MKYISEKDVLIIHARIIDETGGLHGVRELGGLISACARPRASFGGHKQYKTLYQKAGALMHSLAMNHPFLDGNKRTSIATTARLLYINGYDLVVSNIELEKFTLLVVVNKLEVNDIADWLKHNSKKTKK